MKSENFKEMLIKWVCQKCNQENIISIPNQFTKTEAGSEFFLSTKLYPEITCKYCNEKIVPNSTIVQMKKIDPPFFDGTALFFPEIHFELLNPKLSEEEIKIAQEYISRILDHQKENIQLSNRNVQQLIKLVATAFRIERLKEALIRLEEFFNRYITPKYNSSFNFFFAGLTLFDGLVSDKPIELAQEILIQNNIYTKDQLDENNVKFLLILMREIYCLQHLLAYCLSNDIDLQIHDIYNLLDKYNMFFDFIFGFKVSEDSNSHLLEDYRSVRHAIAHSHYIIHEDKVQLVDWEWVRNKPKMVKRLIENYDDIKREMLYFVAILTQLVAIYQLFYQNKKTHKIS